jgi:nucleotide-binding universal stress UspA family protein
MAYKRILVPVDGSRTSTKGLAAALQLAKQSRGSVLLLHVLEEYPVFAAPEIGMAADRIIAGMKQSGRRTLKSASAAAARAGVRAQTAMLEQVSGRVADAVAQQARRWKADLVVMGTHGRRGVKRALLGSDAETTARYSPVPVLLVPPGGR